MTIEEIENRNKEIVLDLQSKNYPHMQTFKKLCDFVDKFRGKIPEDAPIFVERVEDKYLEKPMTGWREHCILDFPDMLWGASGPFTAKDYVDRAVKAEKNKECKWFGEYFTQFLNSSEINYYGNLNAILFRVHY